MREVAIIGVGMHPWGRFPNKTFVDMGVDAALEALRDADMQWTDIQGVAAGIWVWGSLSGLNPGPLVAQALGNTGIPIVNVFTQCATATDCMRTAYQMVASGERDVVMAIGLDKSPEGFLNFAANQIRPDPNDTDTVRWKMVGLTNPAYWALECRKRMEQFGTTELDLARVKVACSKNGALNPRAYYRKVFTEEEVLNSPMLCDPLRLYMVCTVRDGAVAVILCSADKATRYASKPVIIAGTGHGSPLYGDSQIAPGLVSAPSPGRTPVISESWVAARMAFQHAGVGPEDIDFIELPDNSSWHYLHYPELLGFCEPGQMESLVRDGATAVNGRLPINPSGGLASFGEAVGATGLAQVCEVVWQLRGQAGARQVEGTKVGMAQTYGMLGNSAAAIMKV